MANSTEFWQVMQALQLNDLQNLTEENNRLLAGIEKKFDGLLAESQREVFVANVFFAAEKILKMLTAVSNVNDRLFLLSQVGYLYTNDLPIAQRKTSNIQTKRDIDKILADFETLSKDIPQEKLDGFIIKHKDWKNARTKTSSNYQKLKFARRETPFRFTWKTAIIGFLVVYILVRFLSFWLSLGLFVAGYFLMHWYKRRKKDQLADVLQSEHWKLEAKENSLFSKLGSKKAVMETLPEIQEVLRQLI